MLTHLTRHRGEDRARLLAHLVGELDARAASSRSALVSFLG